MSKVLITTDLHIHNHLGSYAFVDNSKEYLDYLLEYCTENDIKNIIVGGDVFNANTTINPIALNIARQGFHNLKAKGIEVHFIYGNHDNFYRANELYNLVTVVFLREFKVMPDYQFINIDNVRFHFKNFTDTFDSSKFNICKDMTNILISHEEINGFKLNNSVNSESGLTVDKFGNFDLVFNGHHHFPEAKNNIIMIGTPYPINFGEIKKENGFIVFDGEKEKFERVKYDKVKMYRFKGNEVDEAVKDSFVRLVSTPEFSEETLIKIKRKLAAQNKYVDIIHERKEGEEEKIEIEVETFDESYKKYIGLFKEKLLKGKKLDENKLVGKFDVIKKDVA